MKYAAPILTGVLVLGALGCHTVDVVGYPGEFVSEHAPTHVWVTTKAEQSVEIWNPHLDGDTLVGFYKGNYWETPLTDVQLMRAKFIAPARTVALASAVAIGTAFFVSQAISGTTGTGSVCYMAGTAVIIICPPPASCPNSYHTGINGC